MANENLAYDIVPEEILDALDTKQLDALYDEVAHRLVSKQTPIDVEDDEFKPEGKSVSILLSYDTYLDVMARKGEYESDLNRQRKKIVDEYNRKLRAQKRVDNFLKCLLFGTGIYVGFKIAIDSAEDLRKLREERKAAKEAKKAAKKAAKQKQNENQGA